MGSLNQPGFRLRLVRRRSAVLPGSETACGFRVGDSSTWVAVTFRAPSWRARAFPVTSDRCRLVGPYIYLVARPARRQSGASHKAIVLASKREPPPFRRVSSPDRLTSCGTKRGVAPSHSLPPSLPNLRSAPRLLTFFLRFPYLGIAWVMSVAGAHRPTGES